MAKLLPYGRQSIDGNDVATVIAALKSDYLTQGPIVGSFEKKISQYVGSKFAVAVNNGTSALMAACLAAGITKGDEVLVPAMTFVASANCVLYCGAKPVLVDVYPDTLTINVEEAEQKITPNTKAIIAVDFAGHPAGWSAIKRLAHKHHLVTIDDASHALGSRYKNKKIGSIADMTIFSFHPVKTITTGEGGMITTNNPTFHKQLLLLRNHGIIKDAQTTRNGLGWAYDMKILGYNMRLTEIQAALGLNQLNRIGEFIKRRKEIAKRYNQYFSEVKSIQTPIERNDVFAAWHLYVIRLLSRNKKTRTNVYNKLKKAGIGVQVHYIPINYFSFYQNELKYKKNMFLEAETYYEQCLSLPMYPDLKDKEQKYVVEQLLKLI